MPEENSRSDTPDEPQGNAPIQPPSQPPGNQNIPAPPPDNNSGENQSTVKELEEDLRSGERWLIGIGIVSVLINTGIALIYMCQLGQMRKATTASADNARIAACAFEENKRQFQQTLQQMKDQSRAMKESADSEVAANRAWIVPDRPPQNLRKIQDAIIEWRNIGKTPATNVYFWREYFQGGTFPSRMSTCAEMVSGVKKKPLNVRQFKAFVAEGGTYEFGLIDPPPWPGPQQPFISIHGCVWYTDIASNAEKSVEFFYIAIQMKYSSNPSDTVLISFPTQKPFVYK